jgi:hypothetical protein
MQIDESDEQCENANSSIHESLEHDSNVIVERALHSRKQSLQSLSTDEGMQIPVKKYFPSDQSLSTIMS